MCLVINPCSARCFFFSSRRRHTRLQGDWSSTCALPIFGEVMADIQLRLDSLQLPPGVVISQGGEVESQQEVFGRIFAALGIAVLFMYLILVMQFGSFLRSEERRVGIVAICRCCRCTSVQ